MTAEMRHPHLFFEAGELERIRAKAEHPRHRRDWEALLGKAHEDLRGPALEEGHPADVLKRAGDAAARCAFAYAVCGEDAFRARALSVLDAILGADGWTRNMIPGQNLDFHLRTAGLCRNLALTYDLLAEEMAQAERDRFVDVCMDKAIRYFLSDCKSGENPHLMGVRTMNWLAVLASGAGWLSTAMDGDGVDLSREIEIARAHVLRFVEWYDEAGAACEHGSYWRYGMLDALTFMGILKRHGWPDIFHQISMKLERVAYPILYGGIGGRNVTNFGDDHHGDMAPAGRDAALILASEFRDERLQWWADHMGEGSCLSLIFGDIDLPATPPDDLPTCAVFHGNGIAVLRSSMTDPDAVLLGLKAGRARAAIFDSPHCQYDLNAVILEAFGSTLLADPGYGHSWTSPTHNHGDPNHPYNGSAAHNTLLVNGEGQNSDYNPVAHLQDLSPDDDTDYVVSRMEQGYGPLVRRFDRHAYMIERRILLLVDDVELTERAALTWNFHATDDARIKVDDSVRITNGNAQLDVIPLGEIELRAEQADDHVLPRVQWDTREPVREARVAWLLWIQRKDENLPAPQVALESDQVVVREGERTWSLPVIRRRTSFRSAMNLPPDLATRANWDPI